MIEVYLLLGTNLGQKLDNLQLAKMQLETKGVRIKAESGIYETAAWGKTDQATFLNQVIQVETELSPGVLLSEIHLVEQEMGRVRLEKWGERLIDVDILYYGNHIIQEKDLVVPHPEIQNRRFTLVPLVDLQPDLVHPVLKVSQSNLLAVCEDPLDVQPYLIKSDLIE